MTDLQQNLQTARVAVFDGTAVGCIDVDLPARSVGEIDIDVTVAAICGSDLHTVLGHRAAPRELGLGHEAVGRVAAADSDAVDVRGTPVRVGDRVALSMIASCGRCDRCAAGLTMKCRSLRKYGHESVLVAPYATGMLADRVRLIPGVPVVVLPDTAQDTVLVSAGCAGATAAAVVSTLAAPRGETVLVLGAGAVGFLSAAMLSTAGCSVVIRDPNPIRQALARKSGADGGSVQDVGFVVEASGHPNAFAEAVASLRIGGRLVAAGAVSPGATNVPFDPADLVVRRLTMIGVHNYTPLDFLQAVDWLIEHGPTRGVGELSSPAYALDDVDRAFEVMRSGRYARVLLRPR